MAAVEAATVTGPAKNLLDFFGGATHPVLKRRVLQLGIPYWRLEFLASGEAANDEICSDHLDFIMQCGAGLDCGRSAAGYALWSGCAPERNRHGSSFQGADTLPVSGESQYVVPCSRA